MGLFDDEVDGSFDEIFDLDDDGYLDPVERGFQLDVVSRDMELNDEDDDYDPDDFDEYFDDTVYLPPTSRVNTSTRPPAGTCSDIVAKSKNHPEPEVKPVKTSKATQNTDTVSVSVGNVRMNSVNISNSVVDPEIDRLAHRKKLIRNLWIIVLVIFVFDAALIIHGSLTKCVWPGCDNLKAPGSRFCELHEEYVEGIQNNKTQKDSASYTYNSTPSTSTQKMKTDSSSTGSNNSSNTGSYSNTSNSRKTTYDSYDVKNYKSAQDFADDKYEEFFDYEDDFEDEDEAYDAAKDYWRDHQKK